MVENKASETVQHVNQFWYETGQAIMQSTFEVQDRSLRYAQNSLMDGIETFKSHIEASQQLRQMGNRPLDQQEALPTLMDSGIEACRRNVAFLQRVTEHGAETLKTNAEAVRDLTQTLMQKSQDHQHAFWG